MYNCLPMLAFLLESFVLGLRSLRLHKLRSLLTALGIIFGVAAVIIMVAIGEGTKKAALEQIQQLGARNILVRSARPPENNEASGRTQRVLEYGLKRDDFTRLKTVSGLKQVVPLRDTEQKVTYNGLRSPSQAIGTTPAIFTVMNLPLARGRYFSDVDSESLSQVCVIGHRVATTLFPFGDPLGEQIQVGTSGMSAVMLTVVGVLEPTGLRAGSEGAAMMNRDLDQDVYFPLSIAQTAFGDTIMKREAGSMERKKIELSEVWLQVDDLTQVETIAGVVENVLMRERAKPDVQVKAPIQILRNAERLNRMFNFIMVGIASFSLVVGGIGIMNIMLATVTERTKEIGIRRALGAKQRHITLQFLIETTVISLTGGLIGVLIGAGVATLLPVIVRLFSDETYRTQITMWSVVGSFSVSGIIGIVFGLYPAMAAARMNPIEALRHE